MILKESKLRQNIREEYLKILIEELGQEPEQQYMLILSGSKLGPFTKKAARDLAIQYRDNKIEFKVIKHKA